MPGMQAVMREPYARSLIKDTRHIHIAKHGGKTRFPSEVRNNMLSVAPRSFLRDLGRMSRRCALDERPDPRVDNHFPEGPTCRVCLKLRTEGEPSVLELTKQEEELIGLLRENSQEFALTITFKSGHWYVGLHAPQTSRQRNDGDGPTFSKAWDDIRPSWT